jgi:uncharacterized delta-60 repeat protein
MVMRIFSCSLAPLACMAALLAAATALAAAGELDPGFGSGGVVSTDVNGAIGTRVHGMARQPDGKLVVVGGAWSSLYGADVALVRLTANGGLDPAFGQNGVVKTDFATPEVGSAVAVEPDGKIVVAVRRFLGADARLDLVRYLSDGTLDVTFGTEGVVATPITGLAGLPYGLAVQHDGKVVAAGTRGTNGVDLVRYTVDGDLDPSFGANGTASTPFVHGDWYRVVVQPDGKILVSASVSTGSDVARYTRDGELDPGFGTAGHVQLLRPFTATSLLVQPDRRILLAGLGTCGPNCDVAVVRLTPGGDPDPSFGTNGFVTTDLGAQETAYGLALQPDGKIVAVGGRRMSFPGNSDFLAVRYTATGALDPAFGPGGTLLTEIAGDDVAMAVAAQPDGKIVAAGDGFATSPYPPTRFAIVRYLGK